MRYSVFLTGALLLATIVGAGSQARAFYQPVTPDLDLVPSDCDGIEKDGSDVPPFVVRLMKKTEKALQRVKVELRSIFNGPDPNERIVELSNQSENLRQFNDEWARFWMLNHPSNLTFEHISGTTGLVVPPDVVKLSPAPPVPTAESLPSPREIVTLPSGVVTLNLSNVSTSLAPVKLAVANVAKEPALLFLQGEDGKLAFQKKVPAGEAIDVETTPGQRWVAIFAENPASENYVATPDKTTWLLRAPPQKEPQPLLAPR